MGLRKALPRCKWPWCRKQIKNPQGLPPHQCDECGELSVRELERRLKKHEKRKKHNQRVFWQS